MLIMIMMISVINNEHIKIILKQEIEQLLFCESRAFYRHMKIIIHLHDQTAYSTQIARSDATKINVIM